MRVIQLLFLNVKKRILRSLCSCGIRKCNLRALTN